MNPLLPVPTQTNSTLLMLLIYGSNRDKFDAINNYNNNCGTAYTYLWVYLFFIIIIIAITFFNLILAIIGEIIKLQDINKKTYIKLKNTQYPILLAILAAIFYILVAFAKALSSNNTLKSISEFNVPLSQAGTLGYTIWFPLNWFPFQQPGLDIATVLYLVSFMSIIRGYTIQSISAFRLSFITAVIFSLASYPTVIGGLQFYYYNNFNNESDCYNYFLSKFISFIFTNLKLFKMILLLKSYLNF